uniref:Uncharacterized protein n=1 Tax=Lygus hesperus TaxID=30085 RepID=A0A0A9ZCX4_LYGHE
MYGAYNQASYYNGTNGHDTGFYQGTYPTGNSRNLKPKDERKTQNSASSHHNSSSSSQQSDRYNNAGHRYNKYPHLAGTRMFNNSQQKRWPERQFSSPSPAIKLRHGPPEPSPPHKPVERVNNLKKTKPYFKQTVDEKDNSEKETVCNNGTKNAIVNGSPAATNQTNSSENKNSANRQGGRKPNPGRSQYAPSGSCKSKNKKEPYNKYNNYFEQMRFFNSYYCVDHSRFMLPPDTPCPGSSAMVVTSPPDNLKNGSCWDKLSEAMWNKFNLNQQCEQVYCMKIRLWEFLYMIIRAYFPRYGLYLVGSSLNGFAMDSSDVDLCLMIHNIEIDQRTDAQMYLGSICGLLATFPFIDELKLIHAKVPLLKFKDIGHGLNVDLNCNNSVGIRNTHLLHGYSQLDWRVKPLVILVKLWAQFHNINDAKCMTLSSYSLSLMVLHFLQCGVRPAILPCLQKLYPEKYNPSKNIGLIHITEEIQPYKNDNNQTLGELFLQFFQYYTHFDFAEDALSVRMGCTIPVETCRYNKSPKNDPLQWKYINIEEPFDHTNTARSVHEPGNYKRILDVFSHSANALEESQALSSVFTLIR